VGEDLLGIQSSFDWLLLGGRGDCPVWLVVHGVLMVNSVWK
jgi:hypothetical protein